MDLSEVLTLFLTPALTAGLTTLLVSILLTRRQEALKFDFARQLEATRHELGRVSVLYQRRADGLAKVWPAIRRAEDVLRNAVSPLKRQGDDEVAQLNGAIQAHQELVGLWDANAVFLPELEEAMDKYTSLLLAVVHDYRMSRTEEMPADMRHQHWQAVMTNMDEVSALRKAIRGQGLPLLASSLSSVAAMPDGIREYPRVAAGPIAQLPASTDMESPS